PLGVRGALLALAVGAAVGLVQALLELARLGGRGLVALGDGLELGVDALESTLGLHPVAQLLLDLRTELGLARSGLGLRGLERVLAFELCAHCVLGLLAGLGSASLGSRQLVALAVDLRAGGLELPLGSLELLASSL